MDAISLYKAAKEVRNRTEFKEVKRIMEKVMERTAIEFQGELFPRSCSCGCGKELKDEAVILQNMGLIFVNEEHLMNYISIRLNLISIGGEEYESLNTLA